MAVDLPILAFDLVAVMGGGQGGRGGGGGGDADAAEPAPTAPTHPTSPTPTPRLAPISLAIIDPCPVSADRFLPPAYAAAVAGLQAAMPGGAASNRAAPEWGAAIFSDACVLARPGGDAAAAAALARTRPL